MNHATLYCSSSSTGGIPLLGRECLETPRVITPNDAPKRKFYDASAAPAPDEPPPVPPDRLPNIHQPLPHNPPRTQGLVPVGIAPADDYSRSPGPATLMAVSPASPGAGDFKKGIKRTPSRPRTASDYCYKSKVRCEKPNGNTSCERCVQRVQQAGGACSLWRKTREGRGWIGFVLRKQL